MIKEYFSHYFLHTSDVTFNLRKNEIKVHSTISEPWKITLVDTGQDTMTGGRLKRVQKYVGDKTFMMTYGDGVADINIKELVEFHKNRRKLATITAVQLAGKFGALNISKANSITSFIEKPKGDGGWVNGGFFVLEPEVFSLIKDDTTTWEKEPLVNLAKKNQLNAYKHNGFWQCMDTQRDKTELELLWNSNKTPWKIWKS
jgi:glucose-1-phosphate cytidylyltransferase